MSDDYLTPDEQAIAARLAKATQGPWVAGFWSIDCTTKTEHVHGRGCKWEPKLFPGPYGIATSILAVVWKSDKGAEMSEADADLIAHAPDDLAHLLAALTAAREALEDSAESYHDIRHEPSIQFDACDADMCVAARRALGRAS